MALDTAAPTGIMGWISTYGNMVYFFGQIIFWLGLLVLLTYAVVQYKRYVNYTLGTGRSGKLRTDQVAEVPSADAAAIAPEGAAEPAQVPVAASAEKPSIDEFVD